MAVKERLEVVPMWDAPIFRVISDGEESVGEISVNVINGNIIITVERIDEAKFGPVSVVVV